MLKHRFLFFVELFSIKKPDIPYIFMNIRTILFGSLNLKI